MMRVYGTRLYPFKYDIMSYSNICPCGFGTSRDRRAITELAASYQRELRDLIASGRYDGDPEFTVVVQPFFRLTTPPKNMVSSVMQSKCHQQFHTLLKFNSIIFLWHSLKLSFPIKAINRAFKSEKLLFWYYPLSTNLLTFSLWLSGKNSID